MLRDAGLVLTALLLLDEAALPALTEDADDMAPVVLLIVLLPLPLRDELVFIAILSEPVAYLLPYHVPALYPPGPSGI